MIDWHCHILPGIDDGAGTLSESLLMARILADSGYKTVCCTPHRAQGIYDNQTEAVRNATSALQKELLKHDIKLTLHPGTEYYLDEFLPDQIIDLLPLPGNLLLVELPTQCDTHVIQRIIAKVIKLGMTPLIAHPERCRLLEPPVQKSGVRMFLNKISGRKRHLTDEQPSSLLTYLHSVGCKFQGNLGSLYGHYGEHIRLNALYLNAGGYYTHWGSDAHNASQLKRICLDQNKST